MKGTSSILGTIYTEVTDGFQRGLYPIARTIKANKADLAVVMKEVGYIDNGTGKHQSNTVYDENGLSPALTTIHGGTQQIKVLERKKADVKIIGKMDNTVDSTFESANRIYDIGGVSPTLNTCSGGGLQPKILVETKPIRMVRTEEGKTLRKAYESGEIHHGFNEHRKAEIKDDCISNAVTTVEKDTLVCEKTIVAMRGRNPDNPADRTKGIELEQRLEVNSSGTSNALTTVQKDNMVFETVKKIGNVNPSGNGQNGMVVDSSGIARTITTEKGEGQKILEKTQSDYPVLIGKDGSSATDEEIEEFAESYEETIYRIRKLTPFECFRLMGVSDEDANKMLSVNSNSQCYKQAGNSIVTTVLMAIFSQLNISGTKTWNDKSEDEIWETIEKSR